MPTGAEHTHTNTLTVCTGTQTQKHVSLSGTEDRGIGSIRI